MKRTAASLIELLVSITIMAVVMSLLLGAAQKALSVATRLICTNNLKQMALASHQRHDAVGSLPDSMQSILASQPYASWRVSLLPYLEQEVLFVQADRDYARDRFRITSHPTFSQLVKVFACPADDRTATTWNVSDADLPVAVSSYLGVAGTVSDRKDGLIYFGSRVQLVHIADGTSNTLLIGERPASKDLRFGWWYAGVGLDFRGGLEHHAGVAELMPLRKYRDCNAGPHQFQQGSLQDHCSMYHFWSLHSGGANFAMADGSVRFIPYTANDLMHALATRSGGEVASLD
jgi:prepilin-type processing-associated H-X9-DG protein